MEQGGQVSGLIDMEMEKLLEDSVPCRVRAKRGCATHPRSIAERVRFFKFFYLNFKLNFEREKRKVYIVYNSPILVLINIFL